MHTLAAAGDSIWSDMFTFQIPATEKILRTILVYTAVALLIRLFGRRILAQLNLSDLVVVLLLSNVVQNAIIGDDNSLSGGLLGALTLVRRRLPLRPGRLHDQGIRAVLRRQAHHRRRGRTGRLEASCAGSASATASCGPSCTGSAPTTRPRSSMRRCGPGVRSTWPSSVRSRTPTPASSRRRCGGSSAHRRPVRRAGGPDAVTAVDRAGQPVIVDRLAVRHELPVLRWRRPTRR